MIVIGTDTHKRTHTCGAVDALTAAARGELTAPARNGAFGKLLRWARALDAERVWAIEDCRHVSGAFERFLIARGERIVRDAPKHMAGARRSSRERGKSDSIDAFSVARAALKEGLEKLPEAHLDGAAMDVRLLVDHREDLVATRGQDQQRLRWHLHDLWPELEIPHGALDTAKWLGKASRRLARAPQTTRVRIARELVRQITASTKRIRELEAELAVLVEGYAPQLLAERGCGPLTAAKLIGEIAGADRFSTDVALAGLVQRFRRSDAIVRQQIKWFVAGAVAAVIGSVVNAASQGSTGAAYAVGLVIGIVATPLPEVAATLAIFRYRLWQIDVVISRALVYAALWAVLSVVLLVPALATGLLVGGTSAVAAVGLALLVTLAFQPARARLERVVERIVYTDRPRGYTVLTRFGETLRAAIGVGELAPHLAEVVRSGLGVSWAGVWVYVAANGGRALRSVAVAGIEPGPSVLIAPATSMRLRSSPAGALTADVPSELAPLWPGKTVAAVVPLVAGDELVGLLACGQRPGDPIGARDLELLALIARESALALRNLRLEAQLRERLAQIEEQAEELRRSRQRLVGVQDEQRRRIERDLHDGVQQQLVALAARLRRASIATPADTHRLLDRLAGEAEEAVFALQELGRGIFPSVLADQGLAAALRTQAARMPITIHVEAEPNLAGRRFEQELEAALYYVALEALANVQKHAPGATATVSLRSAQTARGVVLEVHDDGPGFERRARSPGTGLQNMHDRVAAVGGELEIDSRPGAGTWLRAKAPITATVVTLQPDADSLR
jgi:signal transduction histidine kinase/transposase